MLVRDKNQRKIWGAKSICATGGCRGNSPMEISSKFVSIEILKIKWPWIVEVLSSKTEQLDSPGAVHGLALFSNAERVKRADSFE